MWRAITYVSSGFALVAFIVAVAASVYKIMILKDERLIKQAPEGKRAALIERALVGIKTDPKLSRKQNYALAIEQLRQRADKVRLTAIVVVIIAVLVSVLGVVALRRDSPPPTQKPVPGPEPTKEQRRVDSKFYGKIEQVLAEGNPDGGSEVFLLLSIQNAGDTSIVQDFKLTITQPSALEYKSTPEKFPKETLTLLDEKKSEVTINYQDSMEAKKFQPVESGRVMQGWLRFVVNGVKPEVLRRTDTKFAITFADVSKQTYTVTYQMP
ncbi:MAG TPA: hypothetical protein VJS44_05835 [Pyrinomonadaceae bacterium]|nr:hypothetical protein [Pyrinomonadaceae bacterium]